MIREWITQTVNSLGYVGIALLMCLENVFPPFPSEIIMPLAGFTASEGELSLAGVAIAGTIGSVTGNLVIYTIGRTVGKQRLRQWIDRYGRWLTLSADDLDRAERWFDRYGRRVVFFGRLVPGLRTLISLPAGLCRMSPPWFVLYSTLGMGIWASWLTLLGYFLQENYELVGRYLSPIAYAIVGALLLIAFIWIRRRKA